MDKKEYRQLTLEKLGDISQEDRNKAEKSLIQQIKKEIFENDYQKIGLYYGKYPELTTEKIFQEINGIDIYLPRILPNRQLGFHLYRLGDELEQKWGLNQPVESSPKIEAQDLDLIIVPGVAFSPEGYRVGFGGGYYDRLLAKVSVPTLSLIFKEQAYESGLWPIEDHDQGVGKILVDQRESI